MMCVIHLEDKKRTLACFPRFISLALNPGDLGSRYTASVIEYRNTISRIPDEPLCVAESIYTLNDVDSDISNYRYASERC